MESQVSSTSSETQKRVAGRLQCTTIETLKRGRSWTSIRQLPSFRWQIQLQEPIIPVLHQPSSRSQRPLRLEDHSRLIILIQESIRPKFRFVPPGHTSASETSNHYRDQTRT